MAKGITLDKKDEYELIEKRIVGYTLTTSEPADWSANYTDYFTNTGTLREPVYTAVTGAVAPTWTSGTYYSYSSADVGTDDDGYTIITEPDGTPYNFKKILIAATQPAAGGNFRTVINTKSLSTGQSAKIYYDPTTDYGSTDEGSYMLGFKGEIKKPYFYITSGKLANVNCWQASNNGLMFDQTVAKKLICNDDYIYRINFYSCLIKAGSQITIWAVRT